MKIPTSLSRVPSHSRFFLSLIASVFASVLSINAQTAFPLSSGDFVENFDDIANTTAWPNGFLSTEPWAPVGINTTGGIPSATKTTVSTATFSVGTSAGVQRGAENIYLFTTGGGDAGAGDTTSAAIDLFLSFSNRNAGTLSFNAATVFNNSGSRQGTLRLYYTTDGTSWTEITGGGLPYVATNNSPGSASVNVPLPAALNEAANARFRFYYHNSPTVPADGVVGSRPKISIDNVSVTSAPAGPDTTNPALASLSPANGEPAAPIGSPLTITFSEPVVAGAGAVTLYASSAPTTPLQTFPASSGNFQTTSVTFTPTSQLAYESGYFVTVDPTAFQDAAGNPFDGITSSGWAFTTESEPAPVPPLIVRLSPANDSTDVPTSGVFLEIEYDVDVTAGTGTLEVYSFDDEETPVFSWDINDPNDTIVEGKIVGFLTEVPVEPGKGYYIQAPAGLLLSATGGIASQAFGFNGGEVPWAFEVVMPDITPPSIVSLSPQSGPGAAATNKLIATFDETLTLGSGPWSVTIYDVTAAQNFAEFSETDTTSVTASGTKLTVTLPQNLLPSNAYRVTLSQGVVQDQVGNPSDAITGSTWEFTTSDPLVSGDVVISQVYGGGGNNGATLKNDYIELYNRTDLPVSLAGWSVQYYSNSNSKWFATPLSGTIEPGRYYLVQESAGAAGTEDLPTPDAIGDILVGGTNGIVALSNSTTVLTDINSATDPSVSDFVGYGSVTAFEGTNPAPVLTNTTAAFRIGNGRQDTNDNAADFITGNPFPRNSATIPINPENGGTGTATVTNATAGSGSLIGSAFLPSGTAAQAVRIDLVGTLGGSTLETIEIDIPSGFTTLSQANISFSGAASNTGTGVASLNGQTVTVSGVAITTTDALVVTFTGLTTPDITADPNDNGNRTFTIRTATQGNDPVEPMNSPGLRLVVPVPDVATLRSVPLTGTKAYLMVNQAVVTYLADGGFRNQHWIQDSTAGILIDDPTNPSTLGTTFAVGDGLVNLVGNVSDFRGLLQFTPIAATASVSSMNNFPVPIDVTLAQLAASPLTYQARLVKVTGVTFNPATGNFTNNSEHVLAQGGSMFSFSSFFGASYTNTAVPTTSGDIVGLIRRLSTTPTDFLSPRSSADLTFGAPPASTFGTWSTQYAGSQAPNLDFDNDGVPNGVEYFFGVTAAGFTLTPGIVNGMITFPRDPSVADAAFIVQTSTNLVGWDPVEQMDLDLTDPNSIKYTIPNGTGPFFVRIRVDVTLPTP